MLFLKVCQMNDSTPHVQISYDQDRHCFTNKVTGILRLEDVEENVQEITHHPDFVPGADTIWDLTDATIESMSIAELSGAAQDELMRSDLESGPRFAVVTSSRTQYGLARQLISFVFPDVPNVQVFISMAEAMSWLDRVSYK